MTMIHDISSHYQICIVSNQNHLYILYCQQIVTYACSWLVLTLSLGFAWICFVLPTRWLLFTVAAQPLSIELLGEIAPVHRRSLHQCWCPRSWTNFCSIRTLKQGMIRNSKSSVWRFKSPISILLRLSKVSNIGTIHILIALLLE